jgi:hypothetical protein
MGNVLIKVPKTGNTDYTIINLNTVTSVSVNVHGNVRVRWGEGRWTDLDSVESTDFLEAISGLIVNINNNKEDL